MGRTRTHIDIVLLLALALAFLCAVPEGAEALDVTTLGDYGNVTVMEADGDYDAHLEDGTLNVEARKAVAQEYLRTHADEYDFLIVFTNFDFVMPDGHTDAFYIGVKNDTLGIGQETFDHTEDFDSSGKLQGMVDMGDISSNSFALESKDFEDSLRINGRCPY